MKVAVLLFGQPRFFDITWSLIKEEFDFSLYNVEVDYYFHFWDSVGYTPDSNEETLDYTNILNKEFPNASVQIDDYSELDTTCSIISKFYNEIINNVGVQGSECLSELRYRFGQHLSINKAYKNIVAYEDKNNFKYDLIIKTRTDLIYRSPECYRTQEDYNTVKEGYYFKKPLEVIRTRPHGDFTDNYIKCNALRLIDLYPKIHLNGDVIETGVDGFYNNKHFSSLNRTIWQEYPTNEYYTRLAFNDWFLIASRGAAAIYFSKYFENFYLTIAKDVTFNPNSKRKNCICNSEHCLQGQFLLNYNIFATRPLGDIRRDVRLLHKDEIKPDVHSKDKILCKPGKTTTNYLKYSLIKRWSIDKELGRERADEFANKYKI